MLAHQLFAMENQSENVEMVYHWSMGLGWVLLFCYTSAFVIKSDNLVQGSIVYWDGNELKTSF